MKLGTKLLLVTLALTIGITVFVGGLVTVTVTKREYSNAFTQIEKEIRRGYFSKIEADQRQIFGVAQLLLEGPQYRAMLQSLIDDQGPAREAAVSQLRDEALARMVGHEIGSLNLEPAFDVLLDGSRAPVLIGTRGDAKLEAAIRAIAPSEWAAREVMGQSAEREKLVNDSAFADSNHPSAGTLVRQFVYTPRGLFLAFGMPLRASLSEPPSHAYFVGFRVDGRWADRMLDGQGDRVYAGMGGTEVHAWVRANKTIVAYGATGAPIHDATPPQALLDYQWPKQASDNGTQFLPLLFDSEDGQMVGKVTSVPGVISSQGSGMAVEIFFAASLDKALAPLHAMQMTIVVVGVFSVLIALLLCRWIARSISEPVNLLVEGTKRVAHGQFDKPVDLPRNDELGTLAQSFNAMTQGLAQRDFIKDTFGKFVDPSVVEGLLSDPTKLKPGGEVREQTILFCDLAGFTQISEKLEPQELVKLLNIYLGGAADAVAAERGIVDKFIGDSVMAFWGPPLTETHADRACRAAFMIGARARRLDWLCADLGVSGLKVRVGIATGPVLVGNIGSPNKFNYTVIGDTCNLASRIEGLNKMYGTSVLAPWETISLAIGGSGDCAARFGCRGGLLWRVIDRVRVVGKESPVVLCEVMALVSSEADADPGVLMLARDYAAAFLLYEQQEWQAARDAFAKIDREQRGDGASAEMAKRCAAFATEGPPARWDGVWRMTSK